MMMDIHNEIQSITLTDEYAPINLNNKEFIREYEIRKTKEKLITLLNESREMRERTIEIRISIKC